MTRHEAVAAAVLAAVAVALEETGIDPTRDDELPATCPPEGLVNLRFADPVEVGRQLGAIAREYSRVCAVEIVVQAAEVADRIASFEAILVALGTLQGLAASESGLDWVDLAAPVEAEDLPLDGASPLKGAVVNATLYYQTADNTLEDVT